MIEMAVALFCDVGWFFVLGYVVTHWLTSGMVSD